MTLKCQGCGLDWNVSIYARYMKENYVCPVCDRRYRNGETMSQIQASNRRRRIRGKETEKP